MPITVRWLGAAGFALHPSAGPRVVLNPPSENVVDAADLLLVSHAECGPMEAVSALASRTGAVVVSGAEVRVALEALGLPGLRVRAVQPGMRVEIAGVTVQAVESRRGSAIRLPDGAWLSGAALGFVIDLEPGVRFFHPGDTALFSDLRLIAELYEPTSGCVPIAPGPSGDGPGRLLAGPMTPRQASVAARWLRLETVFPYGHDGFGAPELAELLACVDEMRTAGVKMPEVRVLNPGEACELAGRPAGAPAARILRRAPPSETR